MKNPIAIDPAGHDIHGEAAQHRALAPAMCLLKARVLLARPELRKDFKDKGIHETGVELRTARILARGRRPGSWLEPDGLASGWETGKKLLLT